MFNERGLRFYAEDGAGGGDDGGDRHRAGHDAGDGSRLRTLGGDAHA